MDSTWVDGYEWKETQSVDQEFTLSPTIELQTLVSTDRFTLGFFAVDSVTLSRSKLSAYLDIRGTPAEDTTAEQIDSMWNYPLQSYTGLLKLYDYAADEYRDAAEITLTEKAE